MLNKKKILLCVTGGIAAFKAAALTSLLVKKNAQVRVVMSMSATNFVTPLTFQALSHNKVFTDVFLTEENDISHIELANWADIILVFPATANTIAKIAHGIADNLITTLILASQSTVFVAPAMNPTMFNSKVVARNIGILKTDGYLFLEPTSGTMACGHVGKGRVIEPENTLAALHTFFLRSKNSKTLLGKHILITAGGTIEKIDPVRSIVNHSSGKMGKQLAIVAQELGAKVTLITTVPEMKELNNLEVIIVESAENMYNAVEKCFNECDCFISAAAVADYTPKYVEKKIKKTEASYNLKLTKTKDIVHTMALRKRKQIVVGFAADTENIAENALQKLNTKKLDMVIANDVSKEGAGFNVDTNIITIFQSGQTPKAYPILSKNEVAHLIFEHIIKSYYVKKEEYN